jgi:glutathione synthase/RimK-type ligase-like ATP-grasp enzyme
VEFAVIAHQRSETNLELSARGWNGANSHHLFAPRDALLNLRAGDVALNRLDVSPELDGVEEGLWIVNQLEAQGVRVFNRPPALLAAHDKLITARLLTAAGIPHPRTRALHHATSLDGLSLPVVQSRASAAGGATSSCAATAARSTTTSAGCSDGLVALGRVVQELVPPRSSDLRVIVSGGQVVGAPCGSPRRRVAHERRPRRPARPGHAAGPSVRARARRDAAAGLDFAGVDLLPEEDSWVVLEVNGAVDMRPPTRSDGRFLGCAREPRALGRKPSLASQW